MTTYVIRAVHHDYNDENFYPDGVANVVFETQDLDEAQAKLATLNRKLTKDYLVEGEISEWVFNDPEAEQSTLACLERIMPEEVARTRSAAKGEWEILSNISFYGHRFTGAELDELRIATGAEFYRIITFEGAPVFYRPQYNPEFFGGNAPYGPAYGEESFPVFSESKEEALRVALEQASYNMAKKLPGTPETLSDSPEALSALLADDPIVRKVLKVADGHIAVKTTDDEAFAAAWMAVMPLLKVPPVTCEELDYAQAAELRSEYDELDGEEY